MRNPAILVISADHATVLKEHFWRYSREYDVRVASGAAEAGTLVRELRDAGGDTCLVVAE
mgnify:CR=1 FL=1